ncbi:MAG: tRNA threonylcarbamoyladenosine dehydratase [Oscillospiraceae bacterium]|nr:tRNA threonylcarbamoyladenosine dehydratase [Oscillospiraceae bacterium]
MGYFSRTEILLGKSAMDRLAASSVAIFGLGGVGSYAAEAIVRSGIGRIGLIDGDVVDPTNINRQLIATSKTIGKPKALLVKERACEINPDITAVAFEMFYAADNAAELDLTEYDYIIDAIDTVASKLLLIQNAKAAGVPIISCMGAGNKLDPTAFRAADIYDTAVCPLAKVMRRELRKAGIDSLRVVYSREEPQQSSVHDTKHSGRPAPGSTAFVPPAAGLLLASEVVKGLIMGDGEILFNHEIH